MKNSENLDPILRRINKLLNLAKDNCNENESAVAAMQAEKMMKKYQIDNKELYLAKFKMESEFDSVDVYEFNRLYQWVSFVAVSCSKLFDVRVVSVYNRSGNTKRSIRFQGFKDDVQVAEWTFNYLVEVISKASEDYRQKVTGRGLSATDTFRKSMSMRIGERIDEYIQQRDLEEKGQSGSMELVLAKKSAVEQRFGRQKFKNVSVTRRDFQASMDGQEAGDKVDIFRKGVAGNASNTLFLGQ